MPACAFQRCHSFLFDCCWNLRGSKFALSLQTTQAQGRRYTNTPLWERAHTHTHRRGVPPRAQKKEEKCASLSLKGEKVKEDGRGQAQKRVGWKRLLRFSSRRLFMRINETKRNAVLRLSPAFFWMTQRMSCIQLLRLPERSSYRFWTPRLPDLSRQTRMLAPERV